MKKVDFKKEMKHLYNPSSKRVAVVHVPKMNFLMLDGKGDPNTAQNTKMQSKRCTLYPTLLSLWLKKEER